MAYTPYEWTVNSYVNPTRMNAIEQGIAAASQAAETAAGAFSTIEELIGTKSIAGIGDGTLTGATWKINNDLSELSGVVTTLNSKTTQLETKVNQMDNCTQLAIVEKSGQAYEWRNVTLADSLANYREILFAFANSAGAIFKVTTLPISFFRNYTSGNVFVNICHTENDNSMSRASIYYVNNTTISAYTPRMNDVLNRIVVVGIK